MDILPSTITLAFQMLEIPSIWRFLCNSLDFFQKKFQACNIGIFSMISSFPIFYVNYLHRNKLFRGAIPIRLHIENFSKFR